MVLISWCIVVTVSVGLLLIIKCLYVEQSSRVTCIAGTSPLPWIQGSHPLLVSVLVVIVTKCLT